MAILVERSFTIQRGTAVEFERLSREAIWPYMEARGCKILGLYATVHGGPSNELTLLTAYDSLAHWESTRQDAPPPEGARADLVSLHEKNIVALRERAKLMVVSSSRVLRPVSNWFELDVRPG